jgi:hypothetical protein
MLSFDYHDLNCYTGSSLIGIVTSATALIYIVFQLYFDWLHHGEHAAMYEKHQVWWASIHLPFHIALVLFLEGVNKFVLWRRILESIQLSTSKLLKFADALDTDEVITSEDVSKAIGDFVYSFLKKYKPADVLETYEGVGKTLEDIATLPDSLWVDADVQSNDPDMTHFVNDVSELMGAMINSIFYAFGFEYTEEVAADAKATNPEYLQLELLASIQQRFGLIVSFHLRH